MPAEKKCLTRWGENPQAWLGKGREREQHLLAKQMQEGLQRGRPSEGMSLIIM